MTTDRRTTYAEPNHRQQLALERIEFAVGELSTVLLSNCRTSAVAQSAMRDVRKAVAAIVADILTSD